MTDQNFPTNPVAKWPARLLRRDDAGRKPSSVPGDDSEIYQAGVEAINCPSTMTAGEVYRMDVRIRNEGPFAWPSPDIGIGDVAVTYHWLQPSGEPYHYLGHQTRLPGALLPSATT